MSGSLNTRPCLPKTMPRTSFKSSIPSALRSAGPMLLPAKSNDSQFLTAAYSSWACANTEQERSKTSGRNKRENVKGDFIECLSWVDSPLRQREGLGERAYVANPPL